MTERLASDCRFLRRTIESGRLDGPLVCLCEHPIRSGFECVGPFLEDLPTSCQLWEEKLPAGALPVHRVAADHR